jgi:very-short-patch-repair endonuclease
VGGWSARVDFAYPSVHVAIEADGYRWHSGRLKWEHDLERRNSLTALGWGVVHITWTDLMARSEDLIRSIHALKARVPT